MSEHSEEAVEAAEDSRVAVDAVPAELRVAFQTFGCRSNLADTVDLQTALSERGVCNTKFSQDADVYVINTCTVTDDADKEALRLLRRIRRRRPGARVVVTGCMAEVRAAELQQSGLVDAVVGPGRREEALQAILAAESAPVSAAATPRLSQLRKRWSQSLHDPLSELVPGPGQKFAGGSARARYHLRIQEGCDNHCTFCIIPATRGQLVSRPAERILEDIGLLVARGYREVVLSGTHIGGWGEDLNGLRLIDLLRQIAADAPDCRIRLSSIDPHEVSDEIINLLSTNSLFCPHLHLCFQALDDRILKLMNRRDTVDDIRRLVGTIAQAPRAIRLGADIVTGFPSETRQDVEAQTAVFTELGVSHLHVFPYSEREGTAATRLGESVPVEERKRRAARWRALGERSLREAHCTAVGKMLDVVLEQVEDEGVWGTSAEYLRVFVRTDTCRNSGERVTVRAQRFDEQMGALVCQ